MKCQHCGSENIGYGLHINYSGATTVVARCKKCGRAPERGKPFYSVKDYVISSLPVLIDDRPLSEPCAVCGERKGTQYHHFAPRHLFGFECESWPGAFLCDQHHREWHSKVTPNMSRRK
jgi:hypothetical protein